MNKSSTQSFTPVRCRPIYDGEEDIPLKNKLRREYLLNKSLRMKEVDIILPTFNRCDLLIEAVESVFAQFHRRWNLYVCDDGSTDATHEKLKKFVGDPRFTLLKLPHKGVSAARNCGLKITKSEYISFIDSDNVWNPEYLSMMIAFMSLYDLDCAYSAAKLVGDHNQQWLGDFFSWHACVEQNYIDINCFIVKSTKSKFRFDEKLKRFVDWDYILAVSKESRVSYLPALLVAYCNRESLDRITTTVYKSEDLSSRLNDIQNKHRQPQDDYSNFDVRLCR